MKMFYSIYCSKVVTVISNPNNETNNCSHELRVLLSRVSLFRVLLLRVSLFRVLLSRVSLFRVLLSRSLLTSIII